MMLFKHTFVAFLCMLIGSVTGSVLESLLRVRETSDVTTDNSGTATKPTFRPTPSEHFPHEAILDDDGAYWLFWETNSTHITFETHVKTHGYIGFGLSGNGAMFPGDVVIGWVKDGVTNFKDCHTFDHVMPKEDESQDWVLLQGEERGDTTILKFTRKLDTCDANDFKITDDTTRVIFSYHPDDPMHITSLPWHGRSRRGTRSLLLLSATTNTEQTLPHDAKTFTFVKDNYHVPSKMTTYHCTTYRLPNMTQKHHMIKYEPFVQKGNEKHVHHIVLYTYDRPIGHEFDNINYDCTHGGTPEGLKGSRSVFLAWAVGGGPYYFPEYTGMPLGTEDDPTFFVMETHYDNPTHKSDIVDSSGIVITYTTQLRQHDAGIIYAGMAVSPVQIIPPFQENFISKGFCPEECINIGMEENQTSVNVFAIFQHAHLLGKGIKTRHFRHGKEIKPFAVDNNYDFNYQDVRAMKNEVKLQRGDSFSVECTYDSRYHNKPTYGGLSTEEEMCIITMLYYPRMKLNGCSSFPNYEEVNSTSVGAAIDTMKSWDWTDPSVRQQFKSVLHNSNYTTYCLGPKLKLHRTEGEAIKPTELYHEPHPDCPQ